MTDEGGERERLKLMKHGIKQREMGKGSKI